MKTLPTNVTNNYLKLGSRPRVFVEIDGAGLYIASQAETLDSNSYLDSIKRTGTIDIQIKPFGGIAAVSGISINDLVLSGDYYRNKLCTEAVITPYDGPTIKAGLVLSSTGPGGTYLNTRNAVTGTVSQVVLALGQIKFPLASGYSVWRGFMEFGIPAALTSCEDAFLTWPGRVDNSNRDFNINIFEGKWGAIAGVMFQQFDGWASSGAYTGTILNTLLNSEDYSSGN
ncbi:MAG: hypothetical protein ABIA63_09285, partial [bacterium]